MNLFLIVFLSFFSDSFHFCVFYSRLLDESSGIKNFEKWADQTKERNCLGGTRATKIEGERRGGGGGCTVAAIKGNVLLYPRAPFLIVASAFLISSPL